MSLLLSFILDLLTLGLISFWILSFIKTTKYPQIEKVRHYLTTIYQPMLDIIRNKIKPVVNMGQNRFLDFSPLILMILFALMKKLICWIF